MSLLRGEPVLSPARIVVVDGAAILRVERPLRSPNRVYWAHWSVKNRERQAWQATVKHALMCWIDDQARSRAARGALAPLFTGTPPPAPPGRYTVTITRFVRRVGDLITDEDNLVFSAKPAIDALVSLGYIYSDRREFLERPLPLQLVSKDQPPATEFKITPWWRSMSQVSPAQADMEFGRG